MAGKKGQIKTIKEGNAKLSDAPENANFTLRDTPLVMIWRRVSSLKQSQSAATKIAALEEIGSNNYATIYDGGNVLIGYWVQESFVEQASQASTAQLSEMAVVDSCCDLNYQSFALVSNPAMELTFAPPDFDSAVTELGSQFKLTPSISKTETGENLSFVDDDGNFSSFFRLGRVAANNKVGARLKTFAKRNETARTKIAGHLVGYSLLVSDLGASTKFYKDVLGLKLLKSKKTEAIFDVGTMLLSLKAEPAMGLVSSLSKAGRLLGDWLMFHVNDIEGAAAALANRGVKFPLGIERSGHGLGALFNDPDGHTLTLWQPPNEPTGIDYFPQLTRILASVEGSLDK